MEKLFREKKNKSSFKTPEKDFHKYERWVEAQPFFKDCCLKTVNMCFIKWELLLNYTILLLKIIIFKPCSRVYYIGLILQLSTLFSCVQKSPKTPKPKKCFSFNIKRENRNCLLIRAGSEHPIWSANNSLKTRHLIIINVLFPADYLLISRGWCQTPSLSLNEFREIPDLRVSKVFE